jgi:hypothetical protein
MARTKMTLRRSSGGLWSREDNSHRFKTRRALRYVEDEQGAKTARHASEVTFAQAGDALLSPGILQEVCTYLTGHSLYVSLVCKAWKHCNELAAAESELTVLAGFWLIATPMRVGASNVTLYKAAFESAATVKFAHDNRVSLTDSAVTRSAGKHGSLEALAKFYELDGSWDGNLTNGAAARGMCACTFLQVFTTDLVMCLHFAEKKNSMPRSRCTLIVVLAYSHRAAQSMPRNRTTPTPHFDGFFFAF